MENWSEEEIVEAISRLLGDDQFVKVLAGLRDLVRELGPEKGSKKKEEIITEISRLLSL